MASVPGLRWPLASCQGMPDSMNATLETEHKQREVQEMTGSSPS